MPLVPGTRLGPYEIVAPLGAGGMGEVYRARDPRLGREVAVKVLPEHMARDPQAMERFKREARVIAALSHSNILALYDVGNEDGVFYTVTELLEGETLRGRMGHTPMPWRKVAETGVAIAEGLAAAHGKGIIHRDLKPENIFLTSDGQVKILDFGLARWSPADSADAGGGSMRTSPGTIMGTAAYMSPEQVRGERADAPSDLFSLGCVLYEMASARRPFARETPAETMAAILKEEPAPLGGQAPGVPVELARLVHRSMEKGASQRIQSARDLAFSLKDILAMGSDTAAVVAAPPRVARTTRLAWIAAAVLVLAAAGYAGWRLLRPAPFDSVAVLPFVNVGADPNVEYLSDGIAENLINKLSQLGRIRVVPRSTAFRYKGKDLDLRKVRQDLSVRAALTGRVTQRGDDLNIQAELVDLEADSQLWGRQYSRKLSEIQQVEEEITHAVTARLGVSATGEDQKRLRKQYTPNTEAYQLYLKGRYYWNRRTGETVQRAIGYFQQTIEKDPGYALGWAGLADGYTILPAYIVSSPRDSYPRAIAAAKKALEIDETLAEPHAALAHCLAFYDWDWTGAENAFRRAIELNPKYATAHHWYSLLLQTTGRLEEALKEIQRAAELEPLSLIINTEVGRNYYLLRRHEDAISQLRKILELDPRFFRALLYLGWAYEAKGMYKEAIVQFRLALEQSPGNSQVVAAMGRTQALAGQPGEARKALASLDADSRVRYVEPVDRALVHLGLGEKERAFEWLDRALEQRTSWLRILKVDPRLDPLRSDPRFQALLKRMKLAA